MRGLRREGGGETTWGPQSFIKVWSCLESVVQATASRTAGNNDSYDWYAIKTRKFEIQIFISSNLPRLKNKKPKCHRLKFLHFYYFKYDAIPIISKLHSSTFLIKQRE